MTRLEEIGLRDVSSQVCTEVCVSRANAALATHLTRLAKPDSLN